MIDHKDICSVCKEMIDVEELSEFGMCFDCYKEELDKEFTHEQNASDFWGLL